jgi:hypothetical protein
MNDTRVQVTKKALEIFRMAGTGNGSAAREKRKCLRRRIRRIASTSNPG